MTDEQVDDLCSATRECTAAFQALAEATEKCADAMREWAKDSARGEAGETEKQ